MSLLVERGRMRRRSQVVPAVIAALMLVAVAAGPASARDRPASGIATTTGMGTSASCARGDALLVVRLRQRARARFAGGRLVAHFTGPNITDSWSCPTWFDASVCDNVIAVYRGVATYTSSGNHPVTFRQEYVVTNVGGQEILQQYFVDLFYCPWFRTWEEALAADYNCTFAP